MRKKLLKILLPCLLLCFTLGTFFVSAEEKGGTKIIGEPTILIETDSYSLDEVPNAVLNKEYKIFEASASSVDGKPVLISTNVWLHAGSSTQSKVELKNGAFIPKYYGEYLVEYTAIGEQGNTKTESYVVSCVPKQPLAVSIDEVESSALCGTVVEVAGYTVANFNGNVECEIEAKLQNDKLAYTIEKNSMQFIPEKSGTYDITYTIHDYNEEVKSTYAVTIEPNNQAIIYGEANIPKYLIVGNEYTFDSLQSAHYANGEKVAIIPTIEVEYDTTTEKLQDNKFQPTKAGNIEVVYKATYGNTSVEKRYPTQVVDVNYKSRIDFAKYFDTTDAIATTTENGVLLSTIKEGAKGIFINPLMAKDLNFNFSVSTIDVGLGSLNIYLIDAQDSTQKLKISFRRNGDTTYLQLNDGKVYQSAATFVDDTENLLKYDDENRQLVINNTEKFPINKAFDGGDYTGFSSGKVYLEFEFSKITSKAGVYIAKIRNQNLRSNASNMKPVVFYDSYEGGVENVGDVITINRVYVDDVLDTNITVRYYMYYTDGKSNASAGGLEYLISTDGIELNANNTSYDRAYSFIAKKIGSYNIAIQAVDYSGLSVSYSYAIKVEDSNPPELILIGENNNCEVGEVIRLKDVIVMDDYTQSDNIKLYVYVLQANGNSVLVSPIKGYDGYWYKPLQAGTFKVYYYAYDETNNVAMNSYTFTVTDGGTK